MNGAETNPGRLRPVGRRPRRRGALALLLWWAVAVHAQGADEPLASAVLDITAPVAGETIHSPLALQDFYAMRNFRAAWSGPEATRRGTLPALLGAIERSRDHGLTPDDYHARRLQGSDLAATEIELLATDAWLTLAAHLLTGKLDPLTVEPLWNATSRQRDLPRLLEQALAEGRVGEALEALAPTQPEYRAMRAALARYRAFAAAGDWPRVAPGPALKPGSTDVRIVALRGRLAAAGDLPQDGGGERYDAALVVAVKRFQQRANLEPDGIVGTATLAQLNRTPRDRIAQLRANLERWRWLPDDLGRRHVRVNIADFRLEAIAPGVPPRRFDVIVGRDYRETPVFSDRIRYLVLNPWWETPPSIARQDKLPQFRKDPGSLERQGFVLLDRDGVRVDPAGVDWNRLAGDRFPYRLRQQPGPQNALGRVKIMFPNPHDIYLHDTPSTELFDRSTRAFSSGCIRVKDPLALAAWLLEGTGDWPQARLESTVASGRADLRINLREPVPVHLLYLTVVADDGNLRFVDDIYRRDARLLAALGASE